MDISRQEINISIRHFSPEISFLCRFRLLDDDQTPFPARFVNDEPHAPFTPTQPESYPSKPFKLLKYISLLNAVAPLEAMYIEQLEPCRAIDAMYRS